MNDFIDHAEWQSPGVLGRGRKFFIAIHNPSQVVYALDSKIKVVLKLDARTGKFLGKISFCLDYETRQYSASKFESIEIDEINEVVRIGDTNRLIYFEIDLHSECVSLYQATQIEENYEDIPNHGQIIMQGFDSPTHAFDHKKKLLYIVAPWMSGITLVNYNKEYQSRTKLPIRKTEKFHAVCVDTLGRIFLSLFHTNTIEVYLPNMLLVGSINTGDFFANSICWNSTRGCLLFALTNGLIISLKPNSWLPSSDLWIPECHNLFPGLYRNAIKTILLLRNSLLHTSLSLLPNELIFLIAEFLCAC